MKQSSSFEVFIIFRKPVELAKRYYEEGADEVTFLNITSFRSCPLQDLPMLQVLKNASETIFVPLTIGGGIRGFSTKDPVTGIETEYSAVQVAEMYFQSGADKISSKFCMIIQLFSWV